MSQVSKGGQAASPREGGAEGPGAGRDEGGATRPQVRVQIAGLSDPDDVQFAFAAGAHAVGFTVGLPGGPHDGLTEQRVGEIVRALPPFAATVLITYESGFDGLLELLLRCRTPILQPHGKHDPEVLLRLRRRLPHLKIIKSVNVPQGGTAEAVIREAAEWEGIADAILLDSVDPVTGKLGATGRTHDWSISRQVVEALHLPAILAGGLNPANVADAIDAVRPWGVDVHTGVEVQGVLDRSLLARFIRSALAAGGSPRS